MANGIAPRQNQPAALNYLAAQRALYSKAKNVSALQMFLSVIIICVLSVLSLIIKDTSLLRPAGQSPPDISSIVAVVSVLVAIIDPLVLSRKANALKQTAATIQELFDTSVLSLPWNAVAVGEKPDKEDVLDWARGIRQDPRKLDQLKNWYSPKVDDLPISAARIVCQRSNLWWDAELRRFFVVLLSSITLLFVVLIMLSAIYEGMTLRSFFLSILFPALPVVSYSVRQWIDNKSATTQLSRLKQLVNALWDDLIYKRLADDQLELKSRAVQDQIFLIRKSNPLIFEWVYRLKKPKQEECMHYAVESMIVELRERRQSTNLVPGSGSNG